MVSRNATSTSWTRNLHSIHFLETLHIIWHIFLHQKCWTTINLSHFLLKTNKYWGARFALHLLDSEMHKNPYKHRFFASSSSVSYFIKKENSICCIWAIFLKIYYTRRIFDYHWIFFIRVYKVYKFLNEAFSSLPCVTRLQ